MPHIPSSNHSHGILVQDIATQLQRILSSAEFRRSKRMARFLRLVVDRTLSGDADALKEYVIGTEVFDKDWTFDPRLDSIVRVEARRLRQKLQSYYRGQGAADPIIIELQPGSYVPEFREYTSRMARTDNAASRAASPL